MKKLKFNKLEKITLIANIIAMSTQLLLSNHIINVFWQSVMLLYASILFFIVGVGYKNKGMIVAQFIWFIIIAHSIYNNF